MIVTEEVPVPPPPPPPKRERALCDGCGVEAYSAGPGEAVRIPDGWLWVRLTGVRDVAHLCPTCRQGAVLRLAKGLEASL